MSGSETIRRALVQAWPRQQRQALREGAVLQRVRRRILEGRRRSESSRSTGFVVSFVDGDGGGGVLPDYLVYVAVADAGVFGSRLACFSVVPKLLTIPRPRYVTINRTKFV